MGWRRGRGWHLQPACLVLQERAWEALGMPAVRMAGLTPAAMRCTLTHHGPACLPSAPSPQSLLNEVRMAAGRVILFIDELHMLMDAGRVEGGMNAGGFVRVSV